MPVTIVKPNWSLTVVKGSDKGGYKYMLFCPMQPDNVIRGWRIGTTKTELQEEMTKVCKRMNGQTFAVPKHLATRQARPTKTNIVAQ